MVLFWSDYSWMVDRDGRVLAVPRDRKGLYHRNLPITATVMAMAALVAGFVGWISAGFAAALAGLFAALTVAVLVTWRIRPPAICWQATPGDPLARRAVSVLNQASQRTTSGGPLTMPFTEDLRRVSDRATVQQLLSVVVWSGGGRGILGQAVTETGLLPQSAVMRGREAAHLLKDRGDDKRARVFDRAAEEAIRLTLPQRGEVHELFSIATSVLSADAAPEDEHDPLDELVVQVIDNVIAGLVNVMPQLASTTLVDRDYLTGLAKATDPSRHQAPGWMTQMTPAGQWFPLPTGGR